MQAQEFEIENFRYDLPDEKIAKYPLEERDLSKLLIYKNQEISQDQYKNLADYIPENSLLIFNDTRVIQARILCKNSTGAKIEIFCLEPAQEFTEPVTAMMQQKSIRWRCLVGRLNKWKEQKICLQQADLKLEAEIISREENTQIIEFSWQPAELTFAEIIDRLGEMPIPPYLKRESEEIDQNRYQTVYAKQKGSVAAPTAGLHFTPSIFEALKSKNVSTHYVTLHVGAGTFKPVKTKTIQDHEMHAEWIDVSEDLIKKIILQLENSARIIAVGTTSLRTMESLYWMGLKSHFSPDSSLNDLEIKQWNPYELEPKLTTKEALQSLLRWMERNAQTQLVCKTQIIIVPTYSLKVAHALITNFHQPSSTLLLLVAAVVGESWKTIYKHALENEFRFLSYGDGSLLFSKNDIQFGEKN